MAQPSSNDIVLGRGLVYFNRFLAGSYVGEGERYIGNTTGFSVRRALSTIERLRSVRGVVTRRDELMQREGLSGSFVTDYMTADNVNDWFGGGEIQQGQVPIGEVVESFVIKKGRFYQLGLTHSVIGARHVDFVSIKVDGVPIAVGSDIVLDKTAGRLFIADEATAFNDNALLEATFQWRSAPRMKRFNDVPQTLEGSLRFVATNPVGPKKDCFFPRVTITPTGEFSLKGDEWQQVGFAFEAARLNSRTNLMYIIETGSALYTEDEQAIIDHGGITLDEFPYWEDQLHQTINEIMPAHGY